MSELFRIICPIVGRPLAYLRIRMFLIIIEIKLIGYGQDRTCGQFSVILRQLFSRQKPEGMV